MRYLPLALLIAACASPADLLESGHPFEFRSDRAPRLAANCIARNAEARPFMRAAQANVREADKAGSYEVIIVVPVLAHNDAVVLIDPDGSGGSRIVFRVIGDLRQYDAVVDEYTEGCITERITPYQTGEPGARRRGTQNER